MTTVAQRAAVLRPVKQIVSAEQRQVMSETDWNWQIRQALARQSKRSFHIREASEVGVADLIVYHNYMTASGTIERFQVVDAWLELKVQRPGENWDSLLRPGQREFMRDHWRMGRNAMFVTYDRKVDMFAIRQGDLKGRVKMCGPDPYAINWQEVFDHFKARKVSL